MLSAAVARHLAALDLVRYGDDDTNCFLETLPAEPLTAVAIYTEAGGSVRPWARTPGVQIIVRTDPAAETGRARTGYEWARAILDALHGESHVVWGVDSPDAMSVAWCLSDQAEPFNLGDDENGAPKWSVRFRVETSGAAA